MKVRFAIFNVFSAVIVAAGLFVVYSVGLHYGFVFDDAWLVRNSSLLSEPIALKWNFRSLWVSSYQLIYQAIGPQIYWQRIFNIFLHAVNGILIWVLTVQLVAHAIRGGVSALGAESLSSHSSETSSLVRLAASVGVIGWVFNPVAVYAVQYLTQRSTLMATGFLLTSLLAFIFALQAQSSRGRVMGFVGTVAAYVLAVLSKEHAAPGVVLLFPLYVYLKRPSLRQIGIGAAVIVVPAVLLAKLMLDRKGWVIGDATEDMVRSFLVQLENLQPGSSEQVYLLSLINQMWLFFRYGFLWVFPWVGWMSIDIRLPFPLTWYAFPQLLGALMFVVFLGLSIWALVRRQGRTALFGLIFIVPAILFATELAFVRLQEPFVLYRSYLWSLTLPALFALVLMMIFRSRQWFVSAGLFVMATFGALAFERVQSFRSDLVVWRDALSKIDRNAPPNTLGRWRAPHNIARWDLSEGRFADALVHGKLADEWGAPDGLAKAKIGSALVSLRRPSEALPVLQAALTEGYKGVEIWVSIGSAYDQLGRVEQAFEAYDRALNGGLHDRFRPATLLAAGHLANRVGQHSRAEQYYSELLRAQPDLPAAVTGYALARFRQGDSDQALAVLSDAIARRPAAELFFARGQLHAQLGRRTQAMRDAAQAVALDPRNPAYQALLRQLQLTQDHRGSPATP
ncbi:MAG: tetratricopeptide repeat protein [Tepidimonas sp.]|nr:tetratricopeptide repeat protein [Tepidimonas sp.]